MPSPGALRNRARLERPFFRGITPRRCGAKRLLPTVCSGRRRSALLAVQVMVTLMLVCGTTLLLRNVRSLLAVSPGFNPENVLVAAMTVSARSYPTPPERANHVARILEAHAEGKLLHALLELVRVELARAFVHHGGEEIGDAFLAGGILRAAALEDEAQRDERHCVLLHEPRIDAAGALDLLDLHGVGLGSENGRCEAEQHG